MGLIKSTGSSVSKDSVYENNKNVAINVKKMNPEYCSVDEEENAPIGNFSSTPLQLPKRPNNCGDPLVLARDWRAIIIVLSASVNDRSQRGAT